MYVVITGASRGIGKALAYVFASHKYNLILTCEKNYETLIAIKEDLESKYNVKVIIHQGNIYDVPYNDLIERNKNDVYIVVNNQGKANYNLLQDINRDIYNDLIDTNVTNPIFTTKYFIDTLIRKKEGIIVNISSIWGQVGSSCESIYSMTKGAIDTFTKSMAKELEESGISVIAFSLGMVDTDMNSHLTDEEKEKIYMRLDNNKMFSPVEVANVIYDVISKNKYCTGDIIEIDNGLKKI